MFRRALAATPLTSVVSTSMLAARAVDIQETDGEATVSTRCHYPLVAVPVFFLKTGLWLGLIMIFGGGALGLISPETASPPIRVCAGLFTVIWAALGIWSGPTSFRRAFARSEFHASQSGLRLRHASFLGTSRRDYSWDQVERFTEIVTGGEFNRDLAMVACGRHVALDYGLPAESATQAAAALSRCLEWYRSKCANPQGGANGRQPSRSEAKRMPAAAASRRSS